MSELQKWLVSISGAIVGQIAVLAFFYLLIFHSTTPAAYAKRKNPEPKEVTIMLSQLVEDVVFEPPEPEIPEPKPEPEEPEPEPEPEPELQKVGREFVDTDSSTALAEAPKDARFESDRNTKASTLLLPDPNLPKVSGPTLRGEDAIKHLSLRETEYVDGDIRPEPTPPPPATASPVMPAEIVTPLEEARDAAPNETQNTEESEMAAEEESEGEDDETTPGEADTTPDPAEMIADEVTQPEAETIGDEARMAVSEKTFTDPSTLPGDMELAKEVAEKDESAMALKKTEAFGEPAAPEQKKAVQAMPVASGKSVDQMKREEAAAAEAEIRRQLDESMFSPSFLAQNRKSIQNGDITDIGLEDSVSAESTALGKYKKSVRQAIGKKWHQYRVERAEYVTFGFLRVRFSVTQSGQIKNLRVVKSEAGTTLTEFSLKAIVDAEIPPMPRDVAAELGPRGLEINYNIVIY